MPARYSLLAASQRRLRHAWHVYALVVPEHVPTRTSLSPQTRFTQSLHRKPLMAPLQSPERYWSTLHSVLLHFVQTPALVRFAPRRSLMWLHLKF